MKSIQNLVFCLVLCVPVLSFAKSHSIQMLNSSEGQAMAFSPSVLKVEPGDEVVFVASDTGHLPQSVFIPEGATTWQGQEGKDLTISLTKQGVYIYECLNHFIMGMVGMIVVGKPGNLTQAKAFLESYKSKVLMGKERIDGYLQKLQAME